MNYTISKGYKKYWEVQIKYGEKKITYTKIERSGKEIIDEYDNKFYLRKGKVTHGETGLLVGNKEDFFNELIGSEKLLGCIERFKERIVDGDYPKIEDIEVRHE